MKRAIIAAVVIGIASGQGQTVLVRNKPVDLTPVVKWLERKEGERPMSHWKVIEIESLRGKGVGRVPGFREGGREGAPRDDGDPEHPGDPTATDRGGDWRGRFDWFIAGGCRSASRLSMDPEGRDFSSGFRAVLAPGQ